MTKTFLELLEDLKNAESVEDKAELTNELGLALEEDEKYSERLLQSFFTYTLGKEVGGGFQEIVKGEFFSTRVKAYLDDDYTTKIAVGISYLQNHNHYIDNLDVQVLKTLTKELRKRNLELLVNDISVNELQVRNGNPIDLNSYGG